MAVSVYEVESSRINQLHNVVAKAVKISPHYYFTQIQNLKPPPPVAP